MPWVPKPPPSETHVLIGDDLKEDDSGDEYVPGEEESEDDRDESVTSESDIGSLPPPTPPTPATMEDHATQTTNYTDDGVFKIPPPKSAQEELAEEAANIALRTRSKINLSSTPLETIEKSFVPPDITTDMYDMDCDDEEWREFLKGFTEPLEEATKPTEDEEHDPEYNILADDEINDIDNEDFRVDRAVKITKKEVKELWEELFEYLHHISEDYDDPNKSKGEQSTVNDFFEDSSVPNMSQPQISHLEDAIETSHCNENNTCSEGNIGVEPSPIQKKKDNTALLDITISHQHLCIMELQFRQHVQMLTQNFLLTFEHPEFHLYSSILKEYLLNLKFLSEGKIYSVFRPINLLPALKLVDDWINLCSSNSDDIKVAREHVQQELVKSMQYKMAGNWQYVVTFSKLILEIISKSEVFLFPSLLPKIPFKSEQFFNGKTVFTDAEDNLIAFGLDMFKSFLLDQTKSNFVTITRIAQYVQQYMMPHRNLQQILKHIKQSKHPRCARNPIQQYMLYKKLKPVVHSLHALNQITPPCQRLPDELPIQWRNFIYPWYNETNTIAQNVISITPLEGIGAHQVIFISSPLSGNSLLTSPVQTKCREIKRTRSTRPRKLNQLRRTRKRSNTYLDTSLTSIQQFISIFLRPIPVQKLIRFLTDLDDNGQDQSVTPKKVFVKVHKRKNLISANMPILNTPVKFAEKHPDEGSDESIVVRSTTDNSSSENLQKSLQHEKPETVTTYTMGKDNKKEKVSKSLEFSTITNSSFQKANSSREVEFCRNSDNMQICQTSQCDKLEGSNSTLQRTDSSKDNQENINAPLVTSSVIKSPENKPNAKKELSAEKKKNKIRKEFMANLSIATPLDPETEKYKNEMFAVAYYDKLRETLELEDYHKIMQILNNFTSGDVIDLYNDVQKVLRLKYPELAEEFLFFLKEKEASAVGQLIPWLELQARVKFLRKLEIYLKDQPTQLTKIYNTLMELAKSEDITTEKVKTALVPLLKGNAILLDLFLQNFREERPPPSLLGDSYETIDVNKELARPDNEELYETFVVPNTEDKYGGQNCICHCHKIEDNEYKSRYKHCNACGLKFANGRLYLSAGRTFQPATVTFKTNPDTNHNIRLLGKSAITASSGHKKKRADSSPNKLPSSAGKENLEEDTEDEELGKRKRSVSQKNPRKRKKADTSKYQDSGKPISPKKSPVKCTDTLGIQKDSIKPRKRTYSGKRAKKEETKKVEFETDKVENLEIPVEKTAEEFEIVAEIEESEHEISEEQPEKVVDYCMDSSGESLEKPITSEQQTAESESEIYLEESSQDNYESDDSSSSAESTKGSQSDSNTNDEPAWKREEDTVILETLQKEDDKEYALQIISDKLPNRTIGQIRSRLSRLMDLLIETLKNT